MGERNCAEPSCRALEFRETGYCHHHQELARYGSLAKSDAPPPTIVVSTGIRENSGSLIPVALALSIIGVITILLGSLDWVCCGAILLLVGLALGGFEVMSKMLRPQPFKLT
jgi:hypothetical protein